MADCSPINLFCQARNGVSGTFTNVVEGAFEHMCRSFAEAGAGVLKAVADAFLATSTVELQKAGIDRILVVTTSIGMAIAVLLLLGQVVRTGLTMRGEYLAQAMVGVFKAGLATASVLSVAALLLTVADELSVVIIDRTFGSTEAFAQRFGTAVAFHSLTGTPAALLLVFGLLAVIVGVILFAEMLFRHAAIVVIVAVSPIAAAGMVAGSTANWWRKLVVAGVQLIFLKPLIVLVFAVGFGVAGESKDVLGVLAGLTTLLLAAVAWPALAKMCTWTAAHVAEAGAFTALTAGLVGSQIRRAPSRMSAQSTGSAFDSERATIMRHSSAINSGMAGGSTGAAAAGGPIAIGASALVGATAAGVGYAHGGMSGMAEHGGLHDDPPKAAPRTPPTQGPSTSTGDQ